MTAAIALIEKTKTSPLGFCVIGVLSILALVASARIQIPMVPVPITLQTAVVLLMPCLLGTRLALAILSTYLAMGFAGLPVFAGLVTGPAYFFGPTGGYLLGFVVAAGLVGYIYENKQSWNFWSLSALMLLGHAFILMAGATWLGFGVPSLGLSAAIASGVVPFLIGSVLKSAFAAASIKAAD